MRRIFLYGDVADNFAEVSAPFIEAAGGGESSIALLVAGGPDWEKYIPDYEDPWRACGVGELRVVAPEEGSETLSDVALAELQDCTGIFIAGGDSGRYQGIYACSEARDIIRERYLAGIPYGGTSAGAMLAGETCIVWGTKVKTADNDYWICAPLPHMRDTCIDTDLDLRRGLGLLDCVVESHLAERGRLPRLLHVMEQTDARNGLGLDEAVAVEIQDERTALVRGAGRAYHLEKTDNGAFTIRALDPGTTTDVQVRART